MAVGALEPQFFAALMQGLGFAPSRWAQSRFDRSTWPELRTTFTRLFKEKTRDEWEKIFDGTDACCTPVLTQAELETSGFDQRPIVTLASTPAYAIAQGDATKRKPAEGQGAGVEGSGWSAHGLQPGVGGERVLAQWMGWTRGHHYEVKEGGLQLLQGALNSKL
jgi:alpha-methylacyl-CoA racemase